MAHYAAEGQISQQPIAGGIEISAEQYAVALEGMLNGKLVTINGGLAVIDPPAPAPVPEPEPEEPGLPDRVTSRQFKMQLEIVGLSASVEAWVSAQTKLVQIAYANSGTFVRTEPMLQAGFAALGFSDEEGDEFYIAAAAL